MGEQVWRQHREEATTAIRNAFPTSVRTVSLESNHHYWIYAQTFQCTFSIAHPIRSNEHDRTQTACSTKECAMSESD